MISRGTTPLSPILKWPGGKQDELGVILPALPAAIERYYEPFLGGGAVLLSVPATIPAYANDRSSDLVNLYRRVAMQDQHFFEWADAILNYWQQLHDHLSHHHAALLRLFADFRIQGDELVLGADVDQFVERGRGAFEQGLAAANFVHEPAFFDRALRKSLRNKLKRMRKLELKKGLLSDSDVLDNIEAAIKAAFYYYLRHLYNHSARLGLSDAQHAAIFFFIRENAYAAMFRFNKQGHFNIPYGGISYNRKNLRAKVERLREPALVQRFANTTWGNRDFADFMAQYRPQAGDFVFLDPPYDTEFSSYDQNPFGQHDQQRLADWLLNECAANFMLVIKATPFVRALYTGRSLHIRAFDKTYLYTVKARNQRSVTHLLLTNYAPCGD